jgi:hypothetical protein
MIGGVCPECERAGRTDEIPCPHVREILGDLPYVPITDPAWTRLLGRLEASSRDLPEC